MFKFVITIFLMKSSFVMSSYYGIEDQRSSFIITTDDHKLVGQTIHKRKATDVFDCALCLIGDQCKSFNFNEESGDCYLNGRRAKDKELVQAYGFIYGEKNPCEAKPCQNGGECSIEDNNQGYQCKCKTGFKGNNCQATCNIPVGMESGKIPDSSITASSQWHDYFRSYHPGKCDIPCKVSSKIHT
ncbi:fibropellin-1 [Exaiptasia diaphana]|uniref:EGF-like domain-containing protein n=1 Tax=Exaiptasia diaphana TaxID=2652724 RepID=A0A913WWU6_EXADI|nr:fibropellin-1 [Exaiptasia diaphana]